MLSAIALLALLVSTYGLVSYPILKGCGVTERLWPRSYLFGTVIFFLNVLPNTVFALMGSEWIGAAIGLILSVAYIGKVLNIGMITKVLIALAVPFFVTIPVTFVILMLVENAS
ncbi:hypothetical protein BST95_07735 [Halioglobus japonicus]|uniref:Uncharacterized protein n=1 Tax=Halioglobus japonicus TaxID=930805 RepID=A0AAP8ME59_9GAMM|nr:hypothetical protein BST95_07735 [Halioglobus japonicus]PLW86143.1 hypothetical protein C0029_06775 [Halioglobus japonicus]